MEPNTHWIISGYVTKKEIQSWMLKKGAGLEREIRDDSKFSNNNIF